MRKIPGVFITAVILIVILTGCNTALKKTDQTEKYSESAVSDSMGSVYSAGIVNENDSLSNGETEFLGLSNQEKLDSTTTLVKAALELQEKGDYSAAAYLFQTALDMVYDVDENDPTIEISEYITIKLETERRYRDFLEEVKVLPEEITPEGVIAGIEIAEGDTLLGEDEMFAEPEAMIDTVSLDSVLAATPTLPPIPLMENKKVKNAISFFQGKGRKVFEKWLERAEFYIPLIKQILREEGLPEELVYLSMIESGFNPKAYSYAHAVGPWQFIRSTARIFELKVDWWYDERRDPVRATYAACKYLKKLYSEFDDWYLAMAAYNSGETRVHRHMRYYGTRDFWKLRRLPRQTRNYIPTFLAAWIIAENPEEYGFKALEFKELPPFDSVLVTECIDLKLIAEIMDTTYETVKELNPSVVRWCTPPTQDSIWLKIPLGMVEVFYQKIAEFPEEEKSSWVRHKVRAGETLSIIARKYGTTMKAIADIKSNNIYNYHQIRAGKYLLIPAPPHKYAASSASIYDYEEEYIPDGRSKLVYTVRKGDNLSTIAQRFRTTVSALKQWNNLYGKRFIYPGQELTVWIRDYSTTQAAFSSNIKVTPNGKVHIVRKGESLWSIAQIYGLSLNRLKSLNGFTGYYAMILPGDEIKLYDKTGTVSVSAGESPLAKIVLEDTVWMSSPASIDEDAESEAIHIVQRGESLWRIAQKYNLDVNELKRINGLSGRAIVHPGDKIRLYGDVGTIETPAAAEAGYHIVKQGENLSLIAERYGLEIERLKRINGLNSRSLIYPGDRIKLYRNGEEAEIIIYTVKRGDTLWDIANAYGIEVSELKRFNGIDGGAVIRPGDKIKIPHGG